MNVLAVENLVLYYRTMKGHVKAVDDVSFDVEQGEAMGLVGESGCGKTTIGMSVLQLLPSNAEFQSGRILFKNEDLLGLSDKEMRNVRWKGISMIFQAAMNALNPVHRIESQIVEAITTHEDVPREEARERVAQLYRLVGLDPERAKDYPHEYSGGMKQRAVIAMALSCNPDIIIADEPTTALDVIVQDQIISEIKRLQQKLHMTMIYISHDISVIAESCERIAVMYAGILAEYADAEDLFQNPMHPYTQALMNSFPSIKGPKKQLIPVPGEPPNLLNPPRGCRFHPRCPVATDVCRRSIPVFTEYENRHWAACHTVG
jgi:peptide/nickel transport system ATP-binding protein